MSIKADLANSDFHIGMSWHGRLYSHFCRNTSLSSLTRSSLHCNKKIARPTTTTRSCTRDHGTFVQAPLPSQFKTEDQKIRLVDLREAVNTDHIVEDLVKDLLSENQDLTASATHLFKGGGKYFRPTCVMLMGECCNTGYPDNYKQREIALITELIHVASLIHDDVLDSSDTRRTLQTVNSMFNEKVAILSGDYIIARATSKLARLGCSETITILSSVIRDLIKGEIHQLNKRSNNHEEQLAMYIEKSYLKTASLIAHGCQAVALNSGRPHLQHIAYQYGRNMGIAFQLVDDMLDFISTSEAMGKAAGSDLKLGLATAPVLYAAVKHPAMNQLISRGFNEDGDVELALEMVKDSDGIELTKSLAKRYCDKALSDLKQLPESEYRTGLEVLCDLVLNRNS